MSLKLVHGDAKQTDITIKENINCKKMFFPKKDRFKHFLIQMVECFTRCLRKYCLGRKTSGKILNNFQEICEKQCLLTFHYLKPVTHHP